MISRRRLFWMFLAASVSALPAAAFAEDDHGEHDPGEHAEHQDHGGDDGHDDGHDGGDDHGGDWGGGGKTPDAPEAPEASDDRDGDNDQNLALDAVQNNKAASLKEILNILNEKYEGEVVHVGLQRAGNDVTYSIKLLDPHNNLVEVQINAINRAIILTKGQ